MNGISGGPIPTGWALLFWTWSHLLLGQVVVVNGLGHFHLWNQPATGRITLMNTSDDSQRVLIQTDSLWGIQHPLRITSEVRMAPNSRQEVHYEWFGFDSTSQGMRIFLSTVAEKSPVAPSEGSVRLHIATRYAVDLYRGRIADHLELTWTEQGVRVHNRGGDFWAGACYPLNGTSRGGPRVASGILRPNEVRIWTVPSDANGVWLERVDGAVVASVRP